jgi:hypothetical protein
MRRGWIILAIGSLAFAAQAEPREQRAEQPPSQSATEYTVDTEREASATASVNREGDATFTPDSASTSTVEEGSQVRAALDATASQRDDEDEAPASPTVNREGDASFNP